MWIQYSVFRTRQPLAQKQIDNMKVTMLQLRVKRCMCIHANPQPQQARGSNTHARNKSTSFANTSIAIKSTQGLSFSSSLIIPSFFAHFGLHRTTFGSSKKTE
jgi:hypothetical protein